MKKIFSLLIFALAGLNLANAQDDCLPLPQPPLNTGANMTIMLVTDFVDGLNIQNTNAYMIAIAGGQPVGYTDLSSGAQTSIAIWGDDSLTPEIDGASNGDVITFVLVDGDLMYDIEVESVTYITSGLSVFTLPPTSVSLSSICFVYGCIDPIAENFNADANTEDGTCTYVEGCTDASAFNYDVTATQDDGSCVPFISGCMDEVATNYNPYANTTDESCEYGVPISYALSDGWNMVGYTGTAENSGIVVQMASALGNGSDAASTFSIIKDVTGAYWNPIFAQITTFNQGEGYMMYVIDEQATSVNFQTQGIPAPFSYELLDGWNMVAFTGDSNAETDIVLSMASALGNGSDAASTFSIIKDVTGAYWNPIFAQITTFVPGGAYMMYVIDGQSTSVSFNQQ